MRKITLALGMILFLAGSGFSQAQESISITTYYPSPYGSYDELTTNRLNIGNGGSAPGIFFAGAYAARSEVQGGNVLSFGHPNVSEDQIYYRNNTFYFMDSPGGGDTAAPNVAVMGNMGIGTSSPSNRLEIVGGRNSFRTFGSWSGSSTEPVAEIVSTDSGVSESGTIFNKKNAALNFDLLNVHYQGNSRFYVHSDGNVGIGTINPTQKLEINGKIKITDGSEQDGYILTSDADGVGAWTTPYINIPKPTGTWQRIGDAIRFGGDKGFIRKVAFYTTRKVKAVRLTPTTSSNFVFPWTILPLPSNFYLYPPTFTDGYGAIGNLDGDTSVYIIFTAKPSIGSDGTVGGIEIIGYGDHSADGYGYIDVNIDILW